MEFNIIERRLLILIKYGPALFIIILFLFITYNMSKQHELNLKTEKEIITKQYIKEQKDAIKINIETINNYIKNQSRNAEENLKIKLEQLTQNAHNIMYSIYNDYKDIKSKEEIEKLIKSALTNIRYNEGKGFFSIYDTKGKNIFHPLKKEREGKNFLEEQDSAGLFVNKIASYIMKNGDEGYFVSYKNHDEEPLNKEIKLNFVKKFEPYNWYIQVDESMNYLKKSIKKNILLHLSKIRYKNDEYVFASDFKGTVVLDKHKELIGINVLETKLQTNSQNLFKKFINSNNKNIYIEYNKEKTKISETKKRKISYLLKVDEYDLIIGNGFNFEDLENTIKEKELFITREFNKNLNSVIFTIALISIVLLIVSFILSNLIKKVFFNYKRTLLQKEKIKFESMIKELRDIFDHLPMMLIYKDNKNNIITVNKKTADSLKMSIEELTNVHSKKIFPKDYNKYYEDDLEIIKSKKAKLSYIEKYETIESIKIIETSKIPLFNQKGEVEHIIVFMFDITEKELLRTKNQKQEEIIYEQGKMAVMGEMIGNIAHQLKQPLSAITVTASGIKLENEFRTLTDEDINDAMNSICNSANYLSDTIDDFRNFFKPNKNKLTNFFIEDAVHKTQKLIHAQYKEKDIEIIENIENIELYSYENEFIQVLINIFNNARDELVNKKQRRLIFVDIFKKNKKLIIQIKDNASGISEDIIDKVFNSYFTTKSETDGTGIGLYMTKEIITNHLDGYIYVENEIFKYDNIEYKGAKFTVEINLV